MNFEQKFYLIWKKMDQRKIFFLKRFLKLLVNEVLVVTSKEKVIGKVIEKLKYFFKFLFDYILKSLYSFS